MSLFALNVELQKKMDFTFEEPLPPRAFKWLYGGNVYPVRPERRGENIYWYMVKMVDRVQHRIYLAPAGKLEPDILNNAALQIEAAASPVQP